MNPSRLQDAHLDHVIEERLRTLEAELGCILVIAGSTTPLAQLSMDQTLRLEAIEKELRVTLVAYQTPYQPRLAPLSEEQMLRMQALETELDVTLVAYEHTRTGKLVPNLGTVREAQLSEEQFERLQKVEDETGLLLMAYEPESTKTT